MTYSDAFQAARRADLNQFRQALIGVNLDATTTNERNLLHIAIAYRRPENSIELINRGINVNWQDEEGSTPLHYATNYGQLEVVRLILKKGGDYSVVDKHGNTPLWYAVFNARGHYDIVALLLQSGAVPTLKNNNNRSPLDFAQQIGDEKLISILKIHEKH